MSETTSKTTIVCPNCKGEKHFDRYDGWRQNWYTVRCSVCNGEGTISGYPSEDPQDH